MMDLPEFLASGQRARLFPVLADTSREGRTLSILLSCLCAVDELGKGLMASVGQRLGARAKIEAFTEVCFRAGHDDRKWRPDGLIVVTTGRRTWSALVEAKVGAAELRADQIEAYAQLARANGVDAVITLSNHFVALPEHHPIKLPRGLARSVELYHWSWMYVVTLASLLLSGDDVADTDQQLILRELLRFFRHPSAGVSNFERMNSEWKDVVARVQAGGKLTKSAPEVENTVASWHQVSRALCLDLSHQLGREVRLNLSRAHAGDPVQRLRDDCDALVTSMDLKCSLAVPNAAAPISVKADLRSRCISASMRLAAPADRKSAKARVNWLTRQLAKSEASDIHIRAHWPGKAEPTQAPLFDLRPAPELLEHSSRAMTPNWLEVVMVRDLGARFAGVRTFVERLGEMVPAFYEEVGQHVRAWQPPAPQLRRDPTEADGINETPESVDKVLTTAAV